MKNQMPSDISQLLGGYSPGRFLARYWHKKPLLIRNAVPGLEPVLTKAELFELATRDDAESRLVVRDGSQWMLEHGPFSARALRARRTAPWSLLVQGVNLHSIEADTLMRRFSFIPAARLDDLMISWASDGGGVGPHFDSYDVFLLQAQGRRRWRLSMQEDRSLIPGAPLKLLRRFRATEEYLLEAGDMLYLPPGCAHDGVAEGECMTYSIGFRAPSAQELARGLHEHLADTAARAGMYADPKLRPAAAAALLDDAYVAQAARLIGKIEPTREAIAGFLGRYLTEPKANVYFDSPDQPLGAAAFARAVASRGARLDIRTAMLHRAGHLYINGEAVASSAVALRRLADARHLGPTARMGGEALKLLYAWYQSGWLHPGEHT
jgi:50S ribosomal protein L16 3-hydroxylase